MAQGIVFSPDLRIGLTITETAFAQPTDTSRSSRMARSTANVVNPPGAANSMRRAMRQALAALAGIVAAMAFTAQGFAQHTSLSAKDRALIDAASMQTVEVALAAPPVTGAFGRDTTFQSQRAVGEKIVLKVPAAYLLSVRFYSEGPNPGFYTVAPNRREPGAEALTFAFWSRSFDPVMPDKVADRSECRQRRPHGLCEAGIDNAGRVLARQRGGEYQYVVHMHNAVATEKNRRFSIETHVGLERKFLPPGPCGFREDPGLGMTVGRHPDAEQLPRGPQTRACGISPTGMTFGGKHFGIATFLKRDGDGTPAFGVRCPVFTRSGEGIGPMPCEFVGYFGFWPIQIDLPSDRAAEWGASFEKLRGFLAKHTVSRTD